MKKINILGIYVWSANKTEMMEILKGFLNDGKKHFIVTPNPEIILASEKDEELHYILNQADWAAADGIGLKLGGWLSGKNIKRLTGVDMAEEIMALAAEKHLKVAVLNWEKSLSSNKEIEKALIEKYKNLNLEIKTAGRTPEKCFCGAEVIITNLGAPYQEKFIFHNLDNWPNVKIAIGVGGAFDFLTEKIRRAPKLMRLLGLEWLWRLILEPRLRFKRIINAVIIFPAKFIAWKFFHPLQYRKNVVCLVYKKENGRPKILVVERSDEKGHWQLPQGGTDGLNIGPAALKELSEELGSDKFRIKKIFKDLYHYKFGTRLNENLEKSQNLRKQRGYKGQKQSLAIIEFIGSDSDLKVNYWDHLAFKWIAAENLVREVHDVRKASGKIFFEKFNEIKKEL